MEFNPFLTIELVELSRIRRIDSLRRNMFLRKACICARTARYGRAISMAYVKPF